ncbi:MAG: hypothetical protein LLG20_23440 [Acidobacteriales bacterium]|nr:hypothetical protein [Terriglobales bacterium]
MRVRFGFGRGGNFGVNRFGFNGLRGRRGEGPVPAKLAELIEDGLALESELTFAGGEELRELGAVHEGLEGVGEAIELGGMLASADEGGGLDIDFDIEDAGLGGNDAGETPVDGSKAADEVELSFVDGLEAAEEGLEEVVESVLVFAAEDASELGVAAVLKAVHGGTGLAFGRFGAARAGAVAPGGFELFVSESDKGHDVGSVSIVADGVIWTANTECSFH